MSEQRAIRRLIEAQSAAIARAKACICNEEQVCYGVMSGHDRKTLSLSVESLASGFARTPERLTACALRATAAVHPSEAQVSRQGHRSSVEFARSTAQMGLATELFRRMPGVMWSRYPVDRISALGPLARVLTEGHEHASSAAGRGSPFEKMAACDTCIIGLGKPIQLLTQAHHTEELMGDEFPLPSRAGQPLPMTLVDRDGEIPFELRAQRRWALRHLEAAPHHEARDLARMAVPPCADVRHARGAGDAATRRCSPPRRDLVRPAVMGDPPAIGAWLNIPATTVGWCGS